jgi:hypothetical protein
MKLFWKSSHHASLSVARSARGLRSSYDLLQSFLVAHAAIRDGPDQTAADAFGPRSCALTQATRLRLTGTV